MPMPFLLGLGRAASHPLASKAHGKRASGLPSGIQSPPLSAPELLRAPSGFPDQPCPSQGKGWTQGSLSLPPHRSPGLTDSGLLFSCPETPQACVQDWPTPTGCGFTSAEASPPWFPALTSTLEHQPPVDTLFSPLVTFTATPNSRKTTSPSRG